jgi:hypothetical protein
MAEREKSFSSNEKQCSREQGLDCAKVKALVN